MHRHLLTAGPGRAREHHRVALAPHFLQEREHAAVVEQRVVVHAHRIAAVVPGDIPHRDSLAEIGLEAVHALIEKPLQLQLVPGPRAPGLVQVHHAHARLPEVGLPHAAVGLFHQVPLGLSLPEQRAVLGDVGVDPDAYAQAAVVDLLQKPFRIGEHVGIPLEVAPAEGCIQPQSKWNTDSGRLRSAMPSTKDRTVFRHNRW